ncbi:MAG: MmgE/PrpD family protein [Syntrophus sp. (in: bacteria)]|nr:MmgE/PrpD family protein [Syntrophus sp. (in: bacteria)]
MMETEGRLVDYVYRTTFGDVPDMALKLIKNQVLAVLGTTIAGASAEGCETIVELEKELGGRAEASILIHGGKVPAGQAAFANGVMARALDFCDALIPGAHIGSATISAALASAELTGGCTGADFLAAVTVGTEVAIRLNLGESQYDGFDPTGVCVPFASTAAAAKILRLSEKETWNALALAFNRCGGSFQANVDGSLAVRVIEGWVAETGLTCARLARRGITGPANFLEGVYGYFHLFGRDRVAAEKVVSGLGTEYQVGKLVFKKYPSCGATQGSTEVILNLMAEEGFQADDVGHVDITVPPYIYKLVGHPFHVGNNPKVNAQFSIRYCVANALVRKGSRLAHFEEDAITNPQILALVEKIEVISDTAMDVRGHTALDMCVVTKDGKEHMRKMDIAPGFPGNFLTKEEHLQRFRDCVGFAAKPLPEENIDRIMDAVEHLETINDIRSLIPLLMLE